VRRIRRRSLRGNVRRLSRMKILIVQACMLNTLTECAFRGIYSPRGLIK
jgi:hypothetical protein